MKVSSLHSSPANDRSYNPLVENMWFVDQDLNTGNECVGVFQLETQLFHVHHVFFAAGLYQSNTNSSEFKTDRNDQNKSKCIVIFFKSRAAQQPERISSEYEPFLKRWPL